MNLQPDSSSRHAKAGQSVTAQEFVHEWLRAQANKPGFRESKAVTPRGEIPQLEVSSWLQLPDVFQKLSRGPVQVVFPRSEDSHLTSEQAAIKDFLRANHQTPMGNLLASLSEQIAKSPSFASLNTRPPSPIKRADDWVAAHSLGVATSRCLTTTDLITAPAATQRKQLAAFTRVAQGAVAEHISSGRPLVVNLSAAANLTLISQVLREVCESNVSFASAKESATVWAPTQSAAGSQLEELSIGSFLAKYPSTNALIPNGNSPEKAGSLAALGKVPDSNATDSVLLNGGQQVLTVSPDVTLPPTRSPADEGRANRHRHPSPSRLNKGKLEDIVRKGIASKDTQKVALQTSHPHLAATYLQELCEANPEIAAAEETLTVELSDPTAPQIPPTTFSLRGFLAKYLSSSAPSSHGSKPSANTSTPAPPSLSAGGINNPDNSSTAQMSDREQIENKLLDRLAIYSSSGQRQTVTLINGRPDLVAKILERICETKPEIAAANEVLSIAIKKPKAPKSALEALSLKDFMERHLPSRASSPSGAAPTADSRPPSLPEAPAPITPAEPTDQPGELPTDSGSSLASAEAPDNSPPTPENASLVDDQAAFAALRTPQVPDGSCDLSTLSTEVTNSGVPAPDSLPENVANDPAPLSAEPQGVSASPEPTVPLDSTGPFAGSASSNSPKTVAVAPADASDAEGHLAPSNEHRRPSAEQTTTVVQEQTLNWLRKVQPRLEAEISRIWAIQEEYFHRGLSKHVESMESPLSSLPQPSVGSKAQVVYPNRQEEFVVSEGPAYGLLRECRERSFGASAQRLFQSLEKLVLMRESKTPPPTQDQDLAILPCQGSAIFCSDLEGSLEALALIIDQYKLLERWEKKEPVFLCILGDSIDRSATGSLLIEFLLELKIHRGFSEHIILLAGNHEICAEQNITDVEAHRCERPLLADLFRRKFQKDPDPNTYAEIRAHVEALCPKIALSIQSKVHGVDESLYRERWGLYTLFHSIFQSLPRSIFSENGLYAAHAGFPRHGDFEALFQKEPLAESAREKWLLSLAYLRSPTISSPLAHEAMELACHDQLWSDLSPTLGAVGEFVAQDDPRRHTTPCRSKFTLDDFERFKRATGTSLMIRGHQDNPIDSPHRREMLPESIISQFVERFANESGNYDRDYYKDKISRTTWIHGSIATVEHHRSYAMLDLSIVNPSVTDISWIGLEDHPQPDGSTKWYLSIPPLPEAPAPITPAEPTDQPGELPTDSGSSLASAEAPDNSPPTPENASLVDDQAAFAALRTPQVPDGSCDLSTEVTNSGVPAPDSLPENVANDPAPLSAEPQGVSASPEPALPSDSSGPIADSHSSSSNEAAVEAPASGIAEERAVAQTSERDAAPPSDAERAADEYVLGFLGRRKGILNKQFGKMLGSDFVAGVPKCFQQARQPDPFRNGRVGRHARLSTPGKSEDLLIPEGPACGILRECMGRSLEESTQRLFQSLTKILQMREPAETTGSAPASQQTRDLVILPDYGSAIFMSDLEGSVEHVAMLIDHYKLLERWESKEPVFLCILGDSIDRGDTASLLMEFLFELKVHRGFSENIIILPGNHEISVDQNLEGMWYRKDAPFLGDLFRREYPADSNPSAYPTVRAQLEQLCPEAALSLQSSLSNIDLSRYRERWGLFTLFHSIFEALPRSIVSRNGLYAAHAGFPMHGPFEVLFDQAPAFHGDSTEWLKKLADIRVPEARTNAAYKATHASCNDMIWNDLTTEFGAVGEFVALNDSSRLAVRCRPKFTLDDFARFGKATGTSLMIRGHQNNPNPKDNLPGPVKEFLASLGGDTQTCPEAWVAGNIATVEHRDWCAMLDLSIKQPTIDDIVWIGAKSIEQADGYFKPHLYWPPLPEDSSSIGAALPTEPSEETATVSGQAEASAEAANTPLPTIDDEPRLAQESPFEALRPPQMPNAVDQFWNSYEVADKPFSPPDDDRDFPYL